MTKPKGNTYRRLLVAALESNGGYISGYHDRYALEWNVALNNGVPDSNVLLGPKGAAATWQELQANHGVSADEFDAVIDDAKLMHFCDKWDTDSNLRRVWTWVQEDMARCITDCDSYSTYSPKTAARYGLPGSHAKLHSGKRYDHKHKYRDGAWSHTLSFDVNFGLHGRGGKHLCVHMFEGRSLAARNSELAEAISTDDEGMYSNVWCQKLLAMIHEWNICFSREAVNREFEYQCRYRFVSELNDLYDEAVSEAKEAAERLYWEERGMRTV